MNPELPDADDRRIWGDREPFDPERDEAQLLTVKAIELLMSKDTQGVTDCLERLAGRTGRALFAASWGWSRIAARICAEGVEGDGRYYVEVEEVGIDRETPDDARNVAAFLAAGANDDCHGAVEMWAAMDTPECIELSLEMLQMVTAAVEFKAEDRPRD